MLDVLFSQLIGNICIFLLNQITYLLTCSLNIPDDGTRTSNFTKLFLSMDFYWSYCVAFCVFSFQNRGQKSKNREVLPGPKKKQWENKNK